MLQQCQFFKGKYEISRLVKKDEAEERLKVYLSLLLLGMGLAVLAIELATEETSTEEQTTSNGGLADVTGKSTVVKVLDALEVTLVDLGLGGTGGLAIETTAALERDGQVEVTGILTLEGEDLEETVEGTAVLVDLVEGNAGEANDLVGSLLLVHDLKVKVGLARVGDLEGLVPDGLLTSIVMGEGSLEGLLLGEVERELDVGVLLADVLSLVEVGGVLEVEVEGTVTSVEHDDYKRWMKCSYRLWVPPYLYMFGSRWFFLFLRDSPMEEFTVWRMWRVYV